MSADTAFRQLRDANPVRDPAALRERRQDPAAFLATTQQRSTAMETQARPIIEQAEAPRGSRRPRPGPALAGAAIMIVAIFVTFALLSSDDEGDVTNEGLVQTTAPAPTTTVATTTTTASATTTNVLAFSADDALSVTDAYYEAYNAGDVEAVLALFEPEALFSNNFFEWTRADWEQLLVWNAAQGTALSPPDCTVTAEVSGAVVTVSCRHDNLDALVQAVDGPPVPITLSLAVTPDGISAWVRIFGQPFRPDFDTVGIPFDRWMTVNHPEDLEAVGFGNDLRELPSVGKLWTTVDEAEENGILTARYAAEWATYLNDNGCGYSDGC